MQTTRPSRKIKGVKNKSLKTGIEEKAESAQVDDLSPESVNKALDESTNRRAEEMGKMENG